MKQTPHTTDLPAQLQSLETHLETPVIPGELASWMNDVFASCQRIADSLRAAQATHETQFRIISEQDPELLPRVQELQEEDEEILRDFDQLFRTMEGIHDLSAEQLENQPNVTKAISQIVETGHAFIIRARTQETALTTWLTESFQRDRGEGD